VKLVRSALGHERNLRSRTAATIRVGIAGGHAELLDGILRHAQDAGECITFVLVVYIDAIERDVGLVAAGAIHTAAARVVVTVTGILTEEGHTRLQAQQLDHISAFERKHIDLALVEGIAERGV
jgi:hypothetical protein